MDSITSTTRRPVTATASPSCCSRFFSTSVLLLQSLLILFCLVLLLLFSSPLLLYRWFLSKCCTTLRSDLSHILAIQGANFLNLKTQPEIWNIVLRFKVRGQLAFEDMRAKFLQKCVLATTNSQAEGGQGGGALCYPELQQYCVRWAGYYFWKQEKSFRIEEHVLLREVGSAAPLLTDKDINQFELEYLNVPLTADKSPWEILVVDLPPPRSKDGQEPSFLVLFKFHHSLSDGTGIFEALVKCADEQIPNTRTPTATASPPPARNPCLRLWDALTFPFRASYELAKLLKLKSIRTPWDGWQSNSRTRTGGGQSSTTKAVHRYIARSTGVRLSKIKRIASRQCVSFTGALLAGISGGIRKFLLTKLSEDKIPEYMVCEVPVPLPSTHPTGLSNSVCMVSFSLPVGAATPRGRLDRAEQNVQDRKGSAEPRLTLFLLNMAGLISHAFPSLPLKFPPVAMSNFPGPTTRLKFDGQEVYDMSYVILPLSFALFLTFLSYSNELQFYCIGIHNVFSSDEEMAQIAKFIEEEFDLLEACEVEKRLTGGEEEGSKGAREPLMC